MSDSDALLIFQSVETLPGDQPWHIITIGIYFAPTILQRKQECWAS